jgi:predicted XRE-type DNA-binding protein
VIHPGGLEAARKLADNILNGSDTQFQDLFRLTKVVFAKLVRWLKENANLEDSRYMTAEQKVMIILWIFAQNESQRNTAHKFQISQSTVSEVIQGLLPKFVALHMAFVCPLDDEWLDPDIEFDPKLNAFNGCIGSIDGTHISAFIKARKQTRWRNRKGFVSQNVFAAVRSDTSFTYVLAGAEGSIHDATLCDHAFAESFRVPQNRYYLADSGFGLRQGILIPYSNVRYHLQDWRDAERPPETAKELYNLRHARVRVVVEQTFGILKRQWKIIRFSAPEYSLKKQIKIVYAVTGLHNFILAQEPPRRFTQLEDEALAKARARANQVIGGRSPKTIRRLAAVLMWKAYCNYRSLRG